MANLFTVKAYCEQFGSNRDQFAYYRKRYRSLAANSEPKPHVERHQFRINCN